MACFINSEFHQKHRLLQSVLFWFCALCFCASSFSQQDDVGDDFELDDNLFDLDFAEPGESSNDSRQHWSDPFTFRLSYQTITQVNTHNNRNVLAQLAKESPLIENNRLTLLTKYQHAFADGWLLQGNAQAKVYGRRDYEYVANNNNLLFEARINELFVQRSFGQNSIKLGNQTVAWGEAIGNSVLDVINTTELRDLSVVNIEDARLNQMMLSWDNFTDRARLSTFINLYPQFNPAVKPGSPLYQPNFKQPDLDRNKHLFEVGSQYRWTRTGSDFAIMAAYLYENELRYDPPPGNIGNAIPAENDYWLLGISANRAIDKLLLIADLAYSDGVFADTVNPTLAALASPLAIGRHENKRVGTSVGLEYGITAQQQISFSIRAETFIDQDQAEAGQQLINDNVYGTYLLRYSNTSTTGDVAFSSSLQRTFDDSFFLASAGLNYVLNDDWALSTMLVFTNTEGLVSSNIDDDLRFELSAHFSF